MVHSQEWRYKTEQEIWLKGNKTKQELKREEKKNAEKAYKTRRNKKKLNEKNVL